MPITAKDIVIDALTELGVPNAAGAPAGEDVDLGLKKLNRILDNLNARRAGVYADVLSTHTLTPSLQPHTIGPTGATFTVTQRPEEIQAANIIVSGIRRPLEILDIASWNSISAYTTAGDPTSLYYERAWPLGKLYFYPLNSSSDTLELMTRVLLAQMVLADTFTLPPGYQDLLTLTLAEDLGPAMLVQVPEIIRTKAQQARALVYGNNSVMPRLHTRDAGMPGGGGGFYNYQTGCVE